MEYACGKLEIGGKIFIIVAGGWTGNYGLSSVELLDPTSNHGWFFGIYYSNLQYNIIHL